MYDRKDAQVSEIKPRKGDTVMVTVPGRVFTEVHDSAPGVHVAAGGSDYWVPLSDLYFRDGVWYASERSTNPIR
jgi:hypothetical protein